MSEPVLLCRNLSKSYIKNRPVLENFNFEVQPGCIYGLLGPNGCGKSTLIKLISGLLTPDSGEIYVDGEISAEERASLVSYLPERPWFRPSSRVCELLNMYSDFFGDFERPVAEKMIADFGIDLNAKMQTLSKGTKEKVMLILVMSRRAKLYILDEPIGGVDPAARDYVLSAILGAHRPDSSILLSTHLIQDIEPALDEFSFMGYGGQIIMQGNAENIRSHYGKSLNDIFREVFRCYGNY